jgi:hypothetical protein
VIVNWAVLEIAVEAVLVAAANYSIEYPSTAICEAVFCVKAFLWKTINMNSDSRRRYV